MSKSTSKQVSADSSRSFFQKGFEACKIHSPSFRMGLDGTELPVFFSLSPKALTEISLALDAWTCSRVQFFASQYTERSECFRSEHREILSFILELQKFIDRLLAVSSPSDDDDLPF